MNKAEELARIKTVTEMSTRDRHGHLIKDMNWLISELEQKTEALKFCAEPSGAYSLDKEKYMKNVLEEVMDRARQALSEATTASAPESDR